MICSATSSKSSSVPSSYFSGRERRRRMYQKDVTQAFGKVLFLNDVVEFRSEIHNVFTFLCFDLKCVHDFPLLDFAFEWLVYVWKIRRFPSNQRTKVH